MTTKETFQGWLAAEFTLDELQDMADFGANAGWRGLFYSADLSNLYARYHEEIWDIVSELTEGFGARNPLTFLGQTIGRNVFSDETLKTNIVWLVAEHYARMLIEA